MKIDAKMHPKSDPKIDVWALEGSLFEVLGWFLRSLIFDEFLIWKKSAIWGLRVGKRRFEVIMARGSAGRAGSV